MACLIVPLSHISRKSVSLLSSSDYMQEICGNLCNLIPFICLSRISSRRQTQHNFSHLDAMRFKIKITVLSLLIVGTFLLLLDFNFHFNTESPENGTKLQTQDLDEYSMSKRRADHFHNSGYFSADAVDFYQRVVYNRVPKCGSRSLLTLFRQLSRKNGFHMMDPAINHPYLLNAKEQKRVSILMSALKEPFLYHRHMYFIDFETFNSPPIAYINLIRDPLSRAVSHFYFRRHGDNALNRPRGKVKSDETMTFDECVKRRMYECVGKWGVFFTVPFFCGNTLNCRLPTRWALEKKKNVEKYVVVGILEEYDDFVKVLEKLLPNFFREAYQLFKTPDLDISEKSNLTLTRMKRKPSEETVSTMKGEMKLEYEFYNFIKERFHKQKRSLNII
ncbi:uronyl 2-sulfotransferase-like isoform X2 [Xenia sp. Carnegie-2017]|uniref:uronyl 2-sulfotransferase-like isoform X2 n=1 Tax=Xenia sp. Carnegie-2017 TaxID=2897299 RepID=UPI001F03E71E|nr:uronyl 2-sulfotransferase-like isoform X2 [Xenia sp. Carnegie-2017]